MRYTIPEEDQAPDEVVAVINLIHEAVETGNSRMLLGAYQLLGQKPDRENVAKTLRRATSKGGFTIDDENTDVGRLYYLLHGRDYDGIYPYLGILVSYKNLPRAEKDIINRNFCRKLFEYN